MAAIMTIIIDRLLTCNSMYRNTIYSQRSASDLYFLREVRDIRLKCPAKGHQHKVGKKIMIKAKYSHPRSLGICNLRLRRCICKFIRPRRPIGICLCSSSTTTRRPMAGEGSRGSPAIDRSTWVLVCALARVLLLFRPKTTLPPSKFFFSLAPLLRSTLTVEIGQLTEKKNKQKATVAPLSSYTTKINKEGKNQPPLSFELFLYVFLYVVVGPCERLFFYSVSPLSYRALGEARIH